MNDQQKSYIKARLDEIKGITDAIKIAIDDDGPEVDQQNEGPGNPPPNPPSSGNG